MKIASLVESFLNWCREHRSPATVAHYGGRLKPFVERFGDRELSTLSPLEVQEYLAAVNRWPSGDLKAPDTRRANIVAFERLQSFAIDNRELSEPICKRLEKPKGRERSKLPTPEETRKLLQAARPAFSLIYRALRQSGARPGELCKATIADWNQAAGVIELAEHKTARKTGQPRRIGVGAKLRDLLLQAIGERTEGPIFLSPSGRAWTPKNLGRTFSRLRDQLGLPKHLVLYLTRHEHGTQLAKKKDIRAAARALGHANIKTTLRYAHGDDEELRENQDLME